MLRDELHNKKDLITSLAYKYGATEVQLFGSVARGEERQDSDIDLLVSLPRGYDVFKQRLKLQDELEKLIGRKVDLIIKHEINKHIKEEILSSARDL